MDLVPECQISYCVGPICPFYNTQYICDVDICSPVLDQFASNASHSRPIERYHTPHRSGHPSAYVFCVMHSCHDWFLYNHASQVQQAQDALRTCNLDKFLDPSAGPWDMHIGVRGAFVIICSVFVCVILQHPIRSSLCLLEVWACLVSLSLSIFIPCLLLV